MVCDGHSQNEISDDLVRLAEMLARPHIKAIWFVDRIAEYYWLFQEVDRSGGQVQWLWPSINGIQIVLWRRAVATPEEWEVAPDFCDVPGIWVEMSDGRHIRLEFLWQQK